MLGVEVFGRLKSAHFEEDHSENEEGGTVGQFVFGEEGVLGVEVVVGRKAVVGEEILVPVETIHFAKDVPRSHFQVFGVRVAKVEKLPSLPEEIGEFFLFEPLVALPLLFDDVL